MPTSPFCCDIHHPERFASISSTDVTKEKQTRRSNIKTFDRNSHDLALRDALRRWRALESSIRFGLGNVGLFGGSLVLPNEFMERIVDCAHFNKINTPADLKKETQWSQAEEHGDAILEMIRRHKAPVHEGAFFLVVCCSICSRRTHDHRRNPVSGSFCCGSPSPSIHTFGFRFGSFTHTSYRQVSSLFE